LSENFILIISIYYSKIFETHYTSKMEDYPKIDYVMEREGLHKVCKYSLATG
jgi:hypothetical protein